MDDNLSKFDFQATLSAVGNAFYAVVCHIIFDFALHGMAIAAILALVASSLSSRKHRFVRPFFSLARRISMVCGALMIPGLIAIAITGHLPDTGVYSLGFSKGISSLGFIVFWSMVTIYLSAEELNHEWFDEGHTPDVLKSGAKATGAESAETGELNFEPDGEEKSIMESKPGTKEIVRH